MSVSAPSPAAPPLPFRRFLSRSLGVLLRPESGRTLCPTGRPTQRMALRLIGRPAGLSPTHDCAADAGPRGTAVGGARRAGIGGESSGRGESRLGRGAPWNCAPRTAQQPEGGAARCGAARRSPGWRECPATEQRGAANMERQKGRRGGFGFNPHRLISQRSHWIFRVGKRQDAAGRI